MMKPWYLQKKMASIWRLQSLTPMVNMEMISMVETNQTILISLLK